jgi:hypothetical protein
MIYHVTEIPNPAEPIASPAACALSIGGQAQTAFLCRHCAWAQD